MSPRNTATIQKMVADDFIGVTGDGKIITKKTMLKESTDEKTDASFSVGHMDVRLYGPKVAVVVGTAKQSRNSPASSLLFGNAIAWPATHCQVPPRSSQVSVKR